MVLKFAYKGCAVMLTGDSNRLCWERIVGYYEGRTEEETGTEVLQRHVLHASHHGSRTFVKDSKNDDAYLEALGLIDPEIVIVISVGPDSKHDHPHDDMLKIYEEKVGEGDVLQTCVGGTVRLRSMRPARFASSMTRASATSTGTAGTGTTRIAAVTVAVAAAVVSPKQCSSEERWQPAPSPRAPRPSRRRPPGLPPATRRREQQPPRRERYG